MTVADKKYICAYKHCLHHGDKVSPLESVMINKRHYHWDCAEIKQKIKNCVDLYISHIDDKTQYPMATRVINTLVFKNRIPIDYIVDNIATSKEYYEDKPVHVLYGLKKKFWTEEFTTRE